MSTVDEALEDEAYTWSLDGQRVGTGPDIWVQNPGTGEHTVMLTVKDSQGSAETSVSFWVIAREEPN